MGASRFFWLACCLLLTVIVDVLQEKIGPGQGLLLRLLGAQPALLDLLADGHEGIHPLLERLLAELGVERVGSLPLALPSASIGLDGSVELGGVYSQRPRVPILRRKVAERGEA